MYAKGINVYPAVGSCHAVEETPYSQCLRSGNDVSLLLHATPNSRPKLWFSVKFSTKNLNCVTVSGHISSWKESFRISIVALHFGLGLLATFLQYYRSSFLCVGSRWI